MRLNLRRAQLFEILYQEQRTPWSSLVDMDELLDQDERIHKLLEYILRETTHVRVERLLDPTWNGPLLTTDEVRRRAIQTARQLGTFQLPGAPLRLRDVIVEPCVDFFLSMNIIEISSERPEELWERLEMLCRVATSFCTSPEEFYKRVPNSEDWILRFTTTPDLYRQSVDRQINARHPDVMAVWIKAFQDTVQRRLGIHKHTKMFQISLEYIGLGVEEYWQFRAFLLHKLEQRIARVWSNHKMGIG